MKNEILNIDLLKQENIRLKQEIQYYKNILHQNNIAFQEYLFDKTIPDVIYSTEQKLQIYLDYFKGRSDVFAEKWISKNGKKGFSPVCNNNFVKGFCNKKFVPCSKCKYSDFVIFDDKALIKHLKGNKIYGIYPLLKDNSCYLLAIDFDDGEFTNSAVFFHKICKLYELDTIIERSSSGQGAHVWMFFAEAVPASLARKIASYILSESIKENINIDFSCFDRMFPSQDKVPVGGWGNLIVLPLQGEYGKQGNTLFVDQDFIPYKNQYAALNNTEKISLDKLTALEEYFKVNDFEDYSEMGKKMKDVILSQDDALDKITININNQIILKKKVLSIKTINCIEKTNIIS